MAGADGFEPPVAESESAALPLGEAPIKKALHWSTVHDVSEAQKGSIEWQELMESNHRARIWNPLFSSTELNSYGGTNGNRTHDLLRDRQAF